MVTTNRQSIALGLAGGVVGGAVVGSITGTLIAHGLPAGSLAEWFGAIGTVGALFASVLLLRHEIEVRKADEEERIWAQARQIIVNATVTTTGGVMDPQTLQYVAPYQLLVSGTVRNESDLPIMDLRVVTGVGTDKTGHESGIASVVAPQTTFGHLAAYTDHPAGAPDSAPWAACSFTDSHRVRWRLDSSGNLTRER